MGRSIWIALPESFESPGSILRAMGESDRVVDKGIAATRARARACHEGITEEPEADATVFLRERNRIGGVATIPAVLIGEVGDTRGLAPGVGFERRDRLQRWPGLAPMATERQGQ